jgi:hypothetical protein
MSLADRHLTAVAVTHIGRLHGDVVEVLEGPDAGKCFNYAVVEVEQDRVIETETGIDSRAARFIRFTPGQVPTINGPTRIRIEGKTFSINRIASGSFITTDFEMTEIVAGKDA